MNAAAFFPWARYIFGNVLYSVKQHTMSVQWAATVHAVLILTRRQWSAHISPHMNVDVEELWPACAAAQIFSQGLKPIMQAASSYQKHLAVRHSVLASSTAYSSSIIWTRTWQDNFFHPISHQRVVLRSRKKGICWTLWGQMCRWHWSQQVWFTHIWWPWWPAHKTRRIKHRAS